MVENIVDEEVELHLIDTRQLVEEAKKLKEAQRIKAEQNRLLKKDPNQLREEKELLERLKGKKKPLTSSGAPTPFIGDDEPTLPSEAKKQTRKGAVKGQNTFNAFRESQKKIKRLEKIQKETKNKLNDWQDKYFDKIDSAKGFLSSGGSLGGATGLMNDISYRFGPIGIIVASVISTLTFGFFEQFERGGIFSTKLPITEREKNITEIEYVVDVRSGTKFLTSDLRIAQKAPDTSNTQNLRYEHIRYISQELGK